jgi:hypothetical protein
MEDLEFFNPILLEELKNSYSPSMRIMLSFNLTIRECIKNFLKEEGVYDEKCKISHEKKDEIIQSLLCMSGFVMNIASEGILSIINELQNYEIDFPKSDKIYETIFLKYMELGKCILEQHQSILNAAEKITEKIQ